MRKRRTEITVETHRVLTFQRHGPPRRGWCKNCAREVERITVEETATVLRVDPRVIYDRAEQGELHRTDDCGDGVWICVESL